MGVLTPGEGAVAVDQDSGNGHGIDALEGLDDDIAGLQLILAADLLGGHLPGAGDLTIEVVTLGGADVYKRQAAHRSQ